MANRIDFRFQEMLDGISQEIAEMDKQLGEARKPLFKAIGQKLKKAVQTQVKRAEYNYNRHNYDGAEPYKHVKDDVSVSVKDDGVIVGGGKKTAFKWHLLNDGYLRGTHFISGSHFVDKAIEKSTAEIEQLIEDTLRGVSNGRKN